MATFGKGESFKDQRVQVVSVFDQKAKPGSKTPPGKNVTFGIANDLGGKMTDPMLSYDSYINADGEKKPTFSVGYSAKQWNDVEAAANKDGDRLVVTADLFPRKNGPGLVVNTNSLKTPETPFDLAKHKENTESARAAKKEAAAAKKEAAPEKEQEAALEAE